MIFLLKIFLIAISLFATMAWSFWFIFILFGVGGYVVYTLYKTNPKTAKIIGVLVILILLGGLARDFFEGNFPLSYNSLPWARNYRDAQIAKFMDPGLSEARAVLVRELRGKDDALAAAIPGLMKAEKYEEIKNRTQELINLRKEIDKLLAQTDPPANPTGKRQIQEKIVNFKPGEPANTGLVAQLGDTVKYLNPTATFKSPGKEKFHLISTTTEHEATGFGSIVIYGHEKEGYVQVMVIPKK